MTEAFVFDAIRTPRGKGKKDGSLHEVKPIDLLAGTLQALVGADDLERHGLPPSAGNAHKSDLRGRSGSGERFYDLERDPRGAVLDRARRGEDVLDE